MQGWTVKTAREAVDSGGRLKRSTRAGLAQGESVRSVVEDTVSACAFLLVNVPQTNDDRASQTRDERARWRSLQRSITGQNGVLAGLDATDKDMAAEEAQAAEEALKASAAADASTMAALESEEAEQCAQAILDDHRAKVKTYKYAGTEHQLFFQGLAAMSAGRGGLPAVDGPSA